MVKGSYLVAGIIDIYSPFDQPQEAISISWPRTIPKFKHEKLSVSPKLIPSQTHSSREKIKK